MATLADALRQTGYVQDDQPVPQPSTGMAEMLRQHIASIPQKFEENQANQMAALQRAFPDNTLANADPHAMAQYAMQVPLTGMMVGPQSALWNAENAFNASKLMKQGMPAEEVWKRTGTAKGLDNALRQEISDEGAFLKGGGTFEDVVSNRMKALGVTTPTVEEIMYHPELFESYPYLKHIQVQYMPKGTQGKASFSPTEGIIRVRHDLPAKEATSSMLHELQHGIQEIEGWNKGADANFYLNKYQGQLDDLAEQLSQANKALSNAVGTKDYDKLMEARDKIGKEYRDFLGPRSMGVYEKAIKEYKAHGGEAEARLTQTRQKLNEAQRKEIYPFNQGKNALDINPEEAIIKMEHNTPSITRKELLQKLMSEK